MIDDRDEEEEIVCDGSAASPRMCDVTHFFVPQSELAGDVRDHRLTIGCRLGDGLSANGRSRDAVSRERGHRRSSATPCAPRTV